MQIVTKATFSKEVLESQDSVLVDFYSDTCRPCKALSPILEKLFTGGLKVVKVNAETDYQLAEVYGIRSLPTLLLFKDGEVVATSVGMTTETKIRELFK